MTDSKYTRQTVLDVHTWVPGKLLSLRLTRDSDFEFQPGQFARLGLPAHHAPDAEPTIWRAYSMVSSPGEDALEFYSIVVPEGEFSPRMAALQPGDALYVEKKPFGFLTPDRFEPGGSLWLLASGTGLSAYLSMLRDPATWQRFDRIALVHGVRHAEELAYRAEIENLHRRPDLAPYFAQTPGKFRYLPIATRAGLPGVPQERLTTLLADGRLETLLHEKLDPAAVKIMLCGNPAMLADARKLLSERGFAPGRRGMPGNLAVENYW
ncbi:ferredoxin--NADP reductase [Bordetella holmesii]|uniref:ferredoxin--NADP(+) reductase n=2 Tax=Bordetella holmesii TaxID=35814 RepID=A0A158M173_9BORD|nr:ferredoxin--NADP reductase [Bordetella holmesii]AHV92366.1 oxidoreductase NAD-binding domain protein [Bordetella holmesii ATCC 51541]AIT26920.1 oxidoreductase NAD-binding domain protein [Bordetella holmesii 44057]EWM44335.1 oxidoreductase NAD-binding domain protein [Bordetella holmesii 41130]EWM47503.1 oxidoreductase NAD-binding domain protein [Bordetella holmesii 35009]EWM51668.1 oxidoreductase NAD-binding domain protein [Bordetella holmesii 70147]